MNEREQREFNVLGDMCWTKESYDKIASQVTEEDFTDKNRELFKIIKELWETKGNCTFDSIVDVGEERGILQGEPDMQRVIMIFHCMSEEDNKTLDGVQTRIKLLKRIIHSCNGGCINTYIYPVTEGGACNADSKRYTSVTDSVTAPVTVEDELSKKIKDWIREDTSGWFSYGQLDSELGIKTEADKNNRRLILKRLADKGFVERHQQTNGKYRYTGGTVNDGIDFKNAKAKALDLWLPMDLHSYINLYPGNIAVIAGSPNAGKTCFFLNVIKNNMNKFPIYYFCSEMRADELNDRLSAFDDLDINDWNFEAKTCVANPETQIVPDCVNIIDFVEIVEDPYIVGSILTKIHRKLNNGIALVAIQKKKGTQHVYGRGQEYGEEKARLYLSLDRGTLRVVKAKSWKGFDPNDAVASFYIEQGGAKIVVTSSLTPKAQHQHIQHKEQSSMFGSTI
jgi:hypothetical protein